MAQQKRAPGQGRPGREKVPDTAGNRREGSRWIGDPPDPQDVADWFVANGKFYGLPADDYVAGVTLISQAEKVKRLNANGTILEEERLVHVPYVKVETRVAFFWDLCAKKSWDGAISPVEIPRIGKDDGVAGVFSAHLPEGFFRFPVRVAGGESEVHFVACSKQVEITKTVKGVTRHVRGRPPFGTKQIATLDRWGQVDPHAMMKAETGAIGRALGFAGILVLPGSGVVTAEDMQEMLASGTAGVPAEPESQLPADEQPQAADPRTQIAQLSTRLQSEAPGKLEDIAAWAAERQPPINLDDIKDTQVRAVLGQLERKVAEHDAARE